MVIRPNSNHSEKGTCALYAHIVYKAVLVCFHTEVCSARAGGGGQ